MDFLKLKRKPKLLLHACCIGCGAYVINVLKEDFKVTLLFYNPNIFPEEEYKKRLEDANRIAKKFGLKVVELGYDHKKWLEMARGREADPERGERCKICYAERMEMAANFAKENGFDFFTTTLTVSPYKDARAVSLIGNELAQKYNVRYLDRDFKKQDGYKKSIQLSHELCIYRQNYCGCEFSFRI